MQVQRKALSRPGLKTTFFTPHRLAMPRSDQNTGMGTAHFERHRSAANLSHGTYWRDSGEWEIRA